MKNPGFAAQPRHEEPIAGRDGRISQAWANYFAQLATAQTGDDLRQLYETLAARVAELADGQALRIIGRNSVNSAGASVVEIQLVGDDLTPGNTEYYGTGPDGAKGFFPVADAIEVEAAELDKVVGADGVIALGLADLPDAGGGTLQKTTFDSKGRKTGTSAATTDDLDEGAGNLYYTDARADARAAVAVAAHVAEPDPHTQYTTAIEAAAAAPVQSVNGQTGAVSLLVPKGYIDGLVMQWGSASQIIVSSGDAYIPSLGVVMEVPSAITKSGLSLAPSTWHHVYLFVSGGTPDVEVITTAPSSPYSGMARAKTGDNSRRYLGSVLTDSGGGVFRFAQNGDQIDYVTNTSAPFRVLSGGSATTRTNVSLAGVLPVTSNYVIANTINNSDLQLFIDIPEIGNVGAVSRYTCLANQRTPILAAVQSRTLTYQYVSAPTGAGGFIDVWGYKYGR